MAKFTTISEATHVAGVQELGDIVGVYEDAKDLGEHDKNDVYFVPGFTREELLQYLWSGRIEIALMWKDTDGTWRKLEEEPKAKFSIKTLSEADMILLADEKAVKTVKEIVLNRVCDRTAELSINQAKVNDTAISVER